MSHSMSPGGSQLSRTGCQMVSPRRSTNTSNVDATLFGRSPRRGDKEVIITGKDTVVVRKKMNANAESTPRGNGRSNVVIISADEMNSMREHATIISKAEFAEARRKTEQVFLERMNKSKARKEKILQMEEDRRKNTMDNEYDKGARAQRNQVLERARQMLDEDTDDVKHMNQMMLYSKVVTIRDAQLEEKRAVLAEREEEERQLDEMMEIERLKALQMLEQREQSRLVDQRKGASVIIDQIRERQAQRMREAEALDQERAFVLKQIEALKAEEVEQQRQKQIAAALLLEEVMQVNGAAMKVKEEKLEMERLEYQKIIEYNQNKERREREAEEEKVCVAHEKEIETARLRARQEKAADKASQMDELRAKRAIEGSERAARAKEKAEKDRFEAINQELNEARMKQKAEKDRRLGEQARLEKDEFERIIGVQMQQEAAEKQKQVEQKQLRMQHVEELRAQIQAREDMAAQTRRTCLEEGSGLRSEDVYERRKLEKIKANKIEELKKIGVPEKYWAELARKKILA